MLRLGFGGVGEQKSEDIMCFAPPPPYLPLPPPPIHPSL